MIPPYCYWHYPYALYIYIYIYIWKYHFHESMIPLNKATMKLCFHYTEWRKNNKNMILLCILLCNEQHNDIFVVKYWIGVNNNKSTVQFHVIFHPLFNGSKFSLHNIKQKNNIDGNTLTLGVTLRWQQLCPSSPLIQQKPNSLWPNQSMILFWLQLKRIIYVIINLNLNKTKKPFRHATKSKRITWHSLVTYIWRWRGHTYRGHGS